MTPDPNIQALLDRKRALERELAEYRQAQAAGLHVDGGDVRADQAQREIAAIDSDLDQWIR